MVAEKLAAARVQAEAFGRELRFGIRLNVIVRETEAEAWAAADSLIRNLDDDKIALAQEMMTRRDSEGQRRMMALHGGKRENLEVSPNLWAGLGLVRAGVGTALVGSPEIVAQRMQEYADLGIDNLHHVRLPASGGGVPLRRTGLSPSPIDLSCACREGCPLRVNGAHPLQPPCAARPVVLRRTSLRHLVSLRSDNLSAPLAAVPHRATYAVRGLCRHRRGLRFGSVTQCVTESVGNVSPVTVW